MARKSRELYDAVGTYGPWDNIEPTVTRLGVFATGSGTLAKGTPVGIDANKEFVEWDHDDATANSEASVIHGFLLEDVVLDGTDNVQGLIMVQGRAHIDALVKPTTATAATELQWERALTQLASKGLYISGLSVLDADA